MNQNHRAKAPVQNKNHKKLKLITTTKFNTVALAR